MNQNWYLVFYTYAQLMSSQLFCVVYTVNGKRQQYSCSYVRSL